MADPAVNVCVHCSKVVNRDRKELCNNCGLPFGGAATRAAAIDTRPRKPSRWWLWTAILFGILVTLNVGTRGATGMNLVFAGVGTFLIWAAILWAINQIASRVRRVSRRDEG